MGELESVQETPTHEAFHTVENWEESLTYKSENGKSPPEAWVWKVGAM